MLLKKLSIPCLFLIISSSFVISENQVQEENSIINTPTVSTNHSLDANAINSTLSTVKIPYKLENASTTAIREYQ